MLINMLSKKLFKKKKPIKKVKTDEKKIEIDADDEEEDEWEDEESDDSNDATPVGALSNLVCRKTKKHAGITIVPDEELF